MKTEENNYVKIKNFMTLNKVKLELWLIDIHIKKLKLVNFSIEFLFFK